MLSWRARSVPQREDEREDAQCYHRLLLAPKKKKGHEKGTQNPFGACSRRAEKALDRVSMQIRTTCVIGAGVMGQGIAAHFANAGLKVFLLDIVPPNLTDAEKKDKAARNRFAAGGLEKALKARPAAFFHKSNANLITVGNTEDDLEKVKDCDLVIEAVLERIDVKIALFEKLEKLVPAHAIVASNTSGLRIEDMLKGRSAAFKKNFLVMHFFNPVRYMKLLELVAGPDTDKETRSRSFM